MCTKCQDILISFKIKHQPSNCPLIRSSYCGICAIYGHTTLMCTDQEVLQYRKPQFLEQLLPTSVIDAYGIDTKTPLAIEDPIQPLSQFQPALEVYDTDKNIRAILMNYNKAYSGKAKENRIRIQKLADELGRKLVFLKPTTSVEE